MDFPTIETFEQNKEQSTPIIKWRDLPINTIFHVKSVKKIETASHFGPGMAMSKRSTAYTKRLKLEMKNWKMYTHSTT